MACPDCRPGLCHHCGEEHPDALPAPHMGVVLCNDCFGAALAAPAPSTEETNDG